VDKLSLGVVALLFSDTFLSFHFLSFPTGRNGKHRRCGETELKRGKEGVTVSEKREN
jgi:hypothetical protein